VGLVAFTTLSYQLISNIFLLNYHKNKNFEIFRENYLFLIERYEKIRKNEDLMTLLFLENFPKFFKFIY